MSEKAILLSCKTCDNKNVCPQMLGTQDPKKPCECCEYSRHTSKVGKLVDWKISEIETPT